MRNSIILLITLVVLYLGISLALSGVYGPSYGFLQGEDCWLPNGHGGWVQHGNPTDPPPEGPSRDVPLLARYLPILVPGLLLAVFLFSPLRHKLESPAKPKEPEGEAPADSTPDNDTEQA